MYVSHTERANTETVWSMNYDERKDTISRIDDLYLYGVNLNNEVKPPRRSTVLE